MLDWDDLRFFLAVVRHRTLATASKHLHVTQSTVSRRLASLQEGLGVRLLNRTAEGYVPTMAGESICGHVERVEAEASSLERAVAGHDTRTEGLVRISSCQLLTSHLVAPSVAALHNLQRGIQVEALPEMPDGSLGNREAEIVLRLQRFRDEDLVVRRIGGVAFGFYGSLAYLALHGAPDLSIGCPGHQLITLLNDHEGSAQAAWLAEHAGRAPVTFKADSYETQHWAAYSGGGLALLPRFRADHEAALKRIETPVAVPGAEIWMGVHRDDRQVSRVRIVLDVIAEAVLSRAAILAPAD